MLWRFSDNGLRRERISDNGLRRERIPRCPQMSTA
jgi:hypothetical protein